MYHNYPLNGQAHKVLHGDWYGSKGCGLAVLKVKDLTVNVYTTHVSLITTDCNANMILKVSVNVAFNRKLPIPFPSATPLPFYMLLLSLLSFSPYIS